MSENLIPKIEKEDIKPGEIKPGGTEIVFQRHERYQRTKGLENSGSIFSEAADAAKERNEAFFKKLLEAEGDNETFVFFVSSDTQYDENGRRSLETGQLALDAAQEVMQGMGIDPTKRIINLNDEFTTRRSQATNQEIRPFKKVVEPQIFDTPDYVAYLKDKYGMTEDGGLSQAAWAAHEADAEKEAREALGAEGVHDILDRTKKGLTILQRYAEGFHATHPGKRLVIWTTSHYDTISPLVKDATDTSFEEYVPVDYGGGVVIDIAPGSKEAILKAQQKEVALKLGKSATSKTLTGLS